MAEGWKADGPSGKEPPKRTWMSVSEVTWVALLC